MQSSSAPARATISIAEREEVAPSIFTYQLYTAIGDIAAWRARLARPIAPPLPHPNCAHLPPPALN